MKKVKLSKKLLHKIVKSAFGSSVISFLIYWYARFVGFTNKWKVYGREECFKTWDKEGAIILIGWHGRAIMLPYFWNRYRKINALVSLHQDGLLIAGLLKKFGLGIIGGSSNGNAKGAAMSLMRSLQKDESIAIIPDGPIGPSMELNMSPIYFAQKSGKPIFGMTYSVKNSKIITKSWDDMMLPLPFSKGVCHLTKPFYIPRHATPEELEKYRKEVEDALNAINYQADEAVGITPIKPSRKIKKKRHPKSDSGVI